MQNSGLASRFAFRRALRGGYARFAENALRDSHHASPFAMRCERTAGSTVRDGGSPSHHASLFAMRCEV